MLTIPVLFFANESCTGEEKVRKSPAEMRTCRSILFVMLDSPTSDVSVSTAEKRDCIVSSSLSSGFLCVHGVKFEGTFWEMLMFAIFSRVTREEKLSFEAEVR